MVFFQETLIKENMSYSTFLLPINCSTVSLFSNDIWVMMKSIKSGRNKRITEIHLCVFRSLKGCSILILPPRLLLLFWCLFNRPGQVIDHHDNYCLIHCFSWRKGSNSHFLTHNMISRTKWNFPTFSREVFWLFNPILGLFKKPFQKLRQKADTSHTKNKWK